MSRVIILREPDARKREAWARYWSSEGSDRVVASLDGIKKTLSARFVREVDSIAYACVINIVINAIKLGKHVLIDIDTSNKARYQRVETISRRNGGDVVWLDLAERSLSVSNEEKQDPEQSE